MIINIIIIKIFRCVNKFIFFKIGKLVDFLVIKLVGMIDGNK